MSDNWTDFERPCFDDYDADPMTREMFIAQAEDVLECCDRSEAPDDCAHLAAGGTWATCTSGALSGHCPECLRPRGLPRRQQ